MHELGITQNVLQIAVSEAELHSAKRIKSIRLIVGELSNVDPESISFYFEVLSRSTMAEGANLEFDYVKALARCNGCGTSWPPIDSSFYCPSCGISGAEVFQGNELRVDSLEVE